MPTFKVTDPSTGQTLRLTGDSAPTEQELDQIFSAPRGLRKATAEQGIDVSGPREGDAVSAVLEPAAAIASGIVAEPIAGLAGIGATVADDAEAGAEAVASTREALTFQPRTTRGQEGLAAVSEAIEPVAQAVQGAEQFLGDVGAEIGGPVGGAIGATIPTAALTALGVRKTPGKPSKIDPKRAGEIEGVLAAGERAGVDVLTTDIFPPQQIFTRLAQQFSERIPVVGVGGKRAKQQSQRVAALDEIDQSIPKVQSADIVDSLNRSADKFRVAAGKRINDVVESLDPIGSVPTANAVRAIDSAISKLQAPGKLKNDALIAELDNLKTTLGEAPQSFGSLREFRTDARSIVDAVDPAGRSQLRSSDKALMDGVIKGITSDLDRFVVDNAGSRALQRYKTADMVYAKEAAKLTKSRLKTILDKGDVKPELVNNLLFSSSPSEVKLLFNNLDAGGRQNARLSLYRRALDNATKQGDISPQRFVSELDKLGDNFNTFFRGKSKDELNGLKRLLTETKRAGDAGVVTPTGQATQIGTATGVMGAASVGSPAAIATLLSSGAIGLAARAYESAGVRNLLIRLGKSPKRGTLEADLLKSIPLAFEQAAKSSGEQ